MRVVSQWAADVEKHQTGKQISDSTFTTNLVTSLTCGDIYLCYSFFLYCISVSLAKPLHELKLLQSRMIVRSIEH